MIRVALIATVHCDHVGPDGKTCPRFDEAADRPDFATDRQVNPLLDRADQEFRRRGWCFAPKGKVYCSDHAPTPTPPRKGVRP